MLGLPIGLAFAWPSGAAALRCRSRSSVAMLAVFPTGPIFGLPLIGRYVRTPAVLLALFYGLAVVGWRMLPPASRERRCWGSAAPSPRWRRSRTCRGTPSSSAGSTTACRTRVRTTATCARSANAGGPGGVRPLRHDRHRHHRPIPTCAGGSRATRAPSHPPPSRDAHIILARRTRQMRRFYRSSSRAWRRRRGSCRTGAGRGGAGRPGVRRLAQPAQNEQDHADHHRQRSHLHQQGHGRARVLGRPPNRQTGSVPAKKATSVHNTVLFRRMPADATAERRRPRPARSRAAPRLSARPRWPRASARSRRARAWRRAPPTSLDVGGRAAHGRAGVAGRPLEVRVQRGRRRRAPSRRAQRRGSPRFAPCARNRRRARRGRARAAGAGRAPRAISRRGLPARGARPAPAAGACPRRALRLTTSATAPMLSNVLRDAELVDSARDADAPPRVHLEGGRPTASSGLLCCCADADARARRRSPAPRPRPSRPGARSRPTGSRAQTRRGS